MRFFILLVLFLISIAASAGIQREGYSVIGWNGEYFLIGTYAGELIKYDGKSFSLVSKQSAPVTEIANFSGQWIVGGTGYLGRYDGKSLTPILTGEDVKILRCNAEQCLIYTSSLYSYGAGGLTNLTNILTKELGGKKYFIKDIQWDGHEWLILVREPAATRVLIYRGGRFSKVAFPFNVTLISSNGSAWLLCEKADGKPAKLWLYQDGKLRRLEVPQQVTFTPQAIAWGGGYWLMDTYFSLVKFNGSFAVTKYLEEKIYSPYRVKKMVWNGEYWLILYDLAGTEGSALAKYDGNTIKWLSYPPLAVSKSQWTPIGDITWGKNYWLLGTYVFLHEEGLIQPPQYRSAILKYDGTDFVELKPELSNATAKPEQREKPKSVSAEPPESEERKTICGPSFILLLLLIAPLARRMCFAI